MDELEFDDSFCEEVDLNAIALECRARIESTSGPRSHILFRSFPAGSCGATSDLLARLLAERYGLEALVVCGVKHGEGSHAWVIVDKTIIDITGDQFAGQPAVYVGATTAWHDGWETEVGPYAMPAGWPMYPYEIWRALA